MNLILLSDADFLDSRQVRVTGRRLAYVRDVHHATVGDALRVGRVGGRVGTGTVTALDDDALTMTVVLDRDPPPPLPVTLLLALPRPKFLRRGRRMIESLQPTIAGPRCLRRRLFVVTCKVLGRRRQVLGRVYNLPACPARG